MSTSGSYLAYLAPSGAVGVLGVVGLVAALGVAVACGACGGSQFTAATGSAADAGTDSGASSAGYCAARAGDNLALCSDFDEAQLPESWDSVVKTPPGGTSNATEDTTDPTTPSPPSSLLAVTPSLGPSTDGGASPSASAILTKRALPKGDAHLAFDLDIGKLTFPSPGDANATVVCALVTEGTYLLGLVLHPAPSAPYGLALVEFASPLGGVKTTTPHELAAVPSAGAWTHVKLDLTNSQVTVQLGTAKAETITLTPSVGAATTERTLSIGAASSGPTGDVELRFDNVTWSK